MISRVKHEAEHPAEQEAEHFIVCNYSTYNPERNTKRNGERNAQRNTIKEGIKEGVNEVEKDTHSAGCAGRARVPENSSRNLPATKPIAARGEGADSRKAEEVPVKD